MAWPPALAFQDLRPGQSHDQAMTLAQPGMAWPMAWSQAMHITTWVALGL